MSNEKALKVRESGSDVVFNVVVKILMVLVIVIMAYPLVLTVSCSFSDPKLVMQGDIWLLPEDVGIKSYVNVFKHDRLMTGFKNSIIYTLLATSVNLVLTTCAAYPLSRKDLVGRKVIFTIILFTMFFSGGSIPLFLVVKDLGMLNTPWAIVFPTAINTYNMIIMRTFFESTVPDELLDSARMDGCSDIRFLVKIVLPLSVPVICIMVMYYGVEHWNEFYAPLIYLSRRSMHPLQLVLREILMTASAAMTDAAGLTEQMYEVEGIKYATIVVSSIPMIVAYPFMQKYFRKGVMIGAVKG